MAVYTVDFEEGTTADFDSVTDPNTHIVINGSAAISPIGSYGMGNSYDTDQEYGSLTAAGNLSSILPATTLRLRFYWDINSWTGTGIAENPCIIAYTNDATPKRVFSCSMGTSAVPNRSFTVEAWTNTGSSYGGHTTFPTDEPHMLELLITAGTGSNGTLQYWIDGSSKWSVSDIPWNTVFGNIDEIRFGINVDDTKGGDANGNSQTIYLDDLEINDTGTYIGPAGYDDSDSTTTFMVGTGALLDPDSDVSRLEFVTESFSTVLYPSLQDDDDLFVFHPDSTVNDYFEVAVENPTEVEPGLWAYEWEAYKDSNDWNIQVSAELRQGVTVIATDTEWLTTTPTNYSRLLTSAEQANITDYNDLRIRVRIEQVNAV